MLMLSCKLTVFCNYYLRSVLDLYRGIKNTFISDIHHNTVTHNY